MQLGSWTLGYMLSGYFAVISNQQRYAAHCCAEVNTASPSTEDGLSLASAQHRERQWPSGG